MGGDCQTDLGGSVDRDSVSRLRFDLGDSGRSSWLFQNAPYETNRIRGDIAFHNYWTYPAMPMQPRHPGTFGLLGTGPLTLAPADHGIRLSFNSDQRKKVTIGMIRFIRTTRLGPEFVRKLVRGSETCVFNHRHAGTGL